MGKEKGTASTASRHSVTSSHLTEDALNFSSASLNNLPTMFSCLSPTPIPDHAAVLMTPWRKEATLHAQHLHLCRAVSGPNRAACASRPHGSRSLARSLARFLLFLSRSLARARALSHSITLSQTRKGAFGPDERGPVAVLCQQVQRAVKKVMGSKSRARAPERPLHHRQLGCERMVAHSDREER